MRFSNRFSDGRAGKRTWADVYGQMPVPGDGVLDRRNATPPEGLIPIDLQLAQFNDQQLAAAGLSFEPDTPAIFVPR